MEKNNNNLIKIFVKEKSETINDMLTPKDVAFTEKDINLFEEKFKQLTYEYQEKLYNLKNEIMAFSITCSNIEFDDSKIYDLQRIISLQIKNINKSEIISTSKIDDFCSKLNFTIREKEIINKIYYNRLKYNEIYKVLCITKRTFDDHLKRIVSKLYKFINDEKLNFPEWSKIFPQYPEKETEDGKKTYANPYTVIEHFLNNLL